MPELPEVETIARALRQGGRLLDGRQTPSILGLEIQSGKLLWERSLAQPTPSELWQRLPGQRIQDINRRGKFIVLSLNRDHLLFHLRMSGDLYALPQPDVLPDYTRFLLDLSGGLRLVFADARKFGRIWLTQDPQTVLGNLGPEPLDERFTAADLFERLHARRRQLKPLLLDQTFLAGIGNIYADEALHLARLHPLRLSTSLSMEEVQRLWAATRHVLEEGIRRNGASIDWVYRGGDFQNSFRVYHRVGQPCPLCGTPIERIQVGQRGTHFCPYCQPLDRNETEIRSIPG
jgi:formamidopyrimidine-DNA glycosylase